MYGAGAEKEIHGAGESKRDREREGRGDARMADLSLSLSLSLQNALPFLHLRDSQIICVVNVKRRYVVIWFESEQLVLLSFIFNVVLFEGLFHVEWDAWWT